MKRKALIFLFGVFCLTGLGSCAAPDGPEPIVATAPLIIATPAANETAAPAPTNTSAARVETATPAPSAVSQPASGIAARKYLEGLIAEAGARLDGMPGEKQAVEFLARSFQEMGYEVENQAFTYTNREEGKFDSVNVMAVKPGKSEREIVVGAHYDSAGKGLGADDNGSGVAVLLEAADRIKDVDIPYTIRFIAFGGEELGLNGSEYYVNSLSATALKNIVYMINMDSLIAGDITYVYGSTGANANMLNWMLKDGKEKGFELESKTAAELDPPVDPCDCSDYVSFRDKGIPFVYFEATNWNLGEKDGWMQVDPKYGEEGEIWHTKFDRIDYIDEIAPGRIDRHLEVFTTLLVDALKDYRLPE